MNELMLDIDCSHIFLSRSREEMTTEGLHAVVDQYVGTQVKHLMLNPNSMRTCYASKVWEAFWESPNAKEEKNDLNRRFLDHIYLLHERGIDPYQVMFKRCREKGIHPWLSVRTNDAHYTDIPDHWALSTFWREHPQFRRIPGSTRGYHDPQLDFAHPEVRQHLMKLLDEMLERYDVDGISLDWMREPLAFRPGHEIAGGKLLTQFMAEFRDKANRAGQKRGHKILVGARVPARPEHARGLGLDGVAWAKEGLVDVLAPSPRWATADFDIPMERWRELIGPEALSRVTLAGGTEVLLGAWAFPSAKRSSCDAAAVRGQATGILHRGADRVLMFNYFDRLTPHYSDEDYRQMIRQVGDLRTLLDKPRRHIVTYCDTTPPGVPIAYMLPVEMVGTDPAQFRLYIGPKPTTDGKATLLVGLISETSVQHHRIHIEARCNSDPCGVGQAASGAMEFIKDQKLPSGAQFMLGFDVPLEHLQDGYNLFELLYVGGPSSRAVWVELRIEP
jgi:hypothetical protein